MSAVPKPHKLTEEEYLARDRAAGVKSEFYDGVMYAMAGAKLPHNRIKDNLARHLNNRLDGGPCFAVTSDMRVKVSRPGPYVYPDVVVVCGDPEYAGDREDILVNPVVLVEVLSESTEKYDRTTKRRQYKRIRSVREYVLVGYDEPVVERYARQADGTWAHEEVTGLDAEYAFAAVPARVRLADIYAGVTFPDDPTSPRLAAPPAPPPN
ncbi:MAG: Uma2 family endonuclease [Gemmataceae bacterium]|nr:Uma2 family endonuclease [Gemmataceae bacterium]